MKFFLLFTSLLIGTVYGQNEEDALRYSTDAIGGTARNMSMAGSMTALGGDFSAALQNPASMGKFNKGNFSFTPFVEHNLTKSSYQGNDLNRNRTNLKLGNISLLKAYQLKPQLNGGWISMQLGAGYNRTQTYNERFRYSGTSETSIIDYFTNEAYGINEEDISGTYGYSSGLAYLTFAIDPDLDDNNTTYYESAKSGASLQNRSVESEGGMGEFNFVMSGNYKNKLLVGGSINIVTLEYYTSFDHLETFDQESSFINSIRYTGYLDSEGTGINAKLGAIYIPIEFIRLGLAVETPTRLSMTEYFGNDMITDDDISINTLGNSGGAPTGSFDYIIRTPAKANVSLALLFKKIGSLSAEVEIVDYSLAHMKSLRNSGANFYPFQDENDQIENLYRTAFNIKIGAEARLTQQLYLRGGYAQFESAYKPEKEIFNPSVQFFTGGIGYNFGNTYVDFATVVKHSQNDYHAYDPTLNGSTARIDQFKTQYALTFGYRF